jgi:hypothetical protein
MSEAEIRRALEKALRTRFSVAEWRYLKNAGLLTLYDLSSLLTDEEDWHEVTQSAANLVSWIRTYQEDARLEEAGELEWEYEVETGFDRDPSTGEPDAASSLSDRTVARSRAINSLNRLYARGQYTPRPIIHSTRIPRGGVDGTLPQWVIFIAAEAWVPADDIGEAYRIQQRAVLAERRPPKTQPQTYAVAKFVWEEKWIHHTLPSWPELWKRWNDWPLTKPFDTWKAFYKYFEREPHHRATS